MEIMKSLLLYIVKNIYYSSLLVLPIVVLLGVFKKISSIYRYNICLVALLIIPLLPFIQVPGSFNSSDSVSKIENLSRGVVNKPITAITNIERNPSGENNRIIENRIKVEQITKSIPTTNKLLISNKIDFKILGLNFVLVAYLFTILVLIIRLINSAVTLRKKMLSFKVVTDIGIINIMRDVYEILYIKKNIRVVSAKGISSPFSVGIFKHYIVLPASHSFSNQDLKQILLHEATHIKRNDCLITWFQRVVEILLFFNPAVWIISSSLTRNRELICDGQVVKSLNERESYARILLNTALASINSIPGFCNGAAGSKRDLSKRIDYIINQKTVYKKLYNGVLKICFISLFFSLTLLIGCTNRSSNLYNVYDDIFQIMERINNGEKWIYFWNDNEKDVVLKEISVMEESLRVINDKNSKRNLAYLLAAKSDVLNRSVYDGYSSVFWDKYTIFNKTLKESLKLIDEYGTDEDKGLLYYSASESSMGGNSVVYRDMALEYFIKSGNKKYTTWISYDLLFGEMHKRGAEKTNEKLMVLKKTSTRIKEYGLYTTLNGLENFLSDGQEYLESSNYYGWGSMLFSIKNNVAIQSVNSRYSNITLNSYDIPKIITDNFNIFGLITSITGHLDLPENLNLKKEDFKLKPIIGLATEIIDIKSFNSMEVAGENFENGVKITYKVTQDQSIVNGYYSLLSGINEVWYAKGVGIVKYKNSGEDVVIYLHDYIAEGNLSSYLPLKKGNMWRYSIEGQNSEKFKWNYEIELIKGDDVYMSMYGYQNYSK